MKKEKILYMECYSGISGDMAVGALLDLGADQKGLLALLASLGVEGFRVKIGRRKKCGLDACDFDVILEDPMTEPEPSNRRGQNERCPENVALYAEKHRHEAKEEVSVDEHGAHGNWHEHRNLADVYAVIDRIQGFAEVKQLSRRIFEIVAKAESAAHGIPMEEVHFHEVGAVDSIVDIISTAYCLQSLGVKDVIFSEIYEGRGHTHCQHGVIPVPVPAVVNIMASAAIPLHLTDQNGEMVTPTGAAIVAALRTREGLPASVRVLKTGLGAGKKDMEHANVLRAMLLEEDSPPMAAGPGREENVPALTDGNQPGSKLWVLETNLDDCTGEALGYVMEKLLAAGARDVFYSPVFMKKNRPAYLLKLLCEKPLIPSMEELVFKHTTTIGIRRYPVERTMLAREVRGFATPYGNAQVKICKREDATFLYPEYESIKAICDHTGMDFQRAYYEVMEWASKNI